MNRQAERYAREGVDLSLSTLADQVGAVTELLTPLHALIEAHVMAGSRLHGDDTTVPLLARGGTKTARLWTYVRDDRPFGGTAPPAVAFRFSRDRGGEHPNEHLKGWQGILQGEEDQKTVQWTVFPTNAYAGYNQLYDPRRSPGPVTSALCWSHARRKFFELADVEGNIRKGKSPKEISPIAFEAVRRIDALFEIERDINGKSPDERREARQHLSAPLVGDLERWLRGERALLSKHAKVAKAIDYLLSPNHWPGFTRFLEDGRICLSNNAAERSLRGVALGRKSWLFAGSERGGQRAAAMYALIGTAKLNGIDPQAWLADVIARISDMPVSRLHELLPWEWNLAPVPNLAQDRSCHEQSRAARVYLIVRDTTAIWPRRPASTEFCAQTGSSTTAAGPGRRSGVIHRPATRPVRPARSGPGTSPGCRARSRGCSSTST